MNTINLGNCPILSYDDFINLDIRLAKCNLLYRLTEREIVKVHKYMNKQIVKNQIKQQKKMYDMIVNFQNFVIDDFKKKENEKNE